jgi:hypothetical protein
MTKNFRASAIVMLSLATGFLAVAVAGSSRVALASDKPDASQLAGKWTYNASQSDNAQQKVQEAEQNSRMSQRGSGGGNPNGGGYPGGGGTYPSGGGYPGTDYPGGAGGAGMGRGGVGTGGMGGPGGMGRGGTGRGPGGAAQSEGVNGEDLEALATDPKALTIDQNDKQISIADDADHTENLYPDGKKHKGDDSSGPKTGIKTHWNGNRLVAESKLGHSGKLTETYELSPDGKQLYYTSELDSSRLASPLIIRRVYDNSAAAHAQ